MSKALRKKKLRFGIWFGFIVVGSHSRVRLPDNGVEALLEPLDGVVAGDAVGSANAALGAAATDNTLAGAGHAAVEVHAVDTNTGVVLDAKVDVLADTEAEVAGLAEVALAQLVLLDLEATLENLLGLGATDGDVDSDLFVTADTEGTDGVAGLAWREGSNIREVSFWNVESGVPFGNMVTERTVDRSLTRQLLEHLGGTGQSVTRLADGDVQDELLDAELPHGVLGLLRLEPIMLVLASINMWAVELYLPFWRVVVGGPDEED